MGNQVDRREFLRGSALTLAAFSAPVVNTETASAQTGNAEHSPSTHEFWPDGAKLVISVSMQMEAGAEPTSGAESPMPKIDPRYPDLPATKWYDYGFKEGLPRLLDMFERRNVKVTSHMVGAAVESHPELAKEIVQRGHEAAGHGQT